MVKRRQNFERPRGRGAGRGGGQSEGFRIAQSFEDVLAASNLNKRRKRFELQDKRATEQKAKINLSASLDAWINKPEKEY